MIRDHMPASSTRTSLRSLVLAEAPSLATTRDIHHICCNASESGLATRAVIIASARPPSVPNASDDRVAL